MRRLLAPLLLGLVLVLGGPVCVQAQLGGAYRHGFGTYGYGTGYGAGYGAGFSTASVSAVYTDFTAAPGLYGTAYGAASFGVPRTYSTFSSSYGPGYMGGYGPYGYVPGRYGVGLWRPGYSVPGYEYRSSAYNFYRTFPYTIRPPVASVPMGVYAPAYGGPPSYLGW